MYEALCRHLRSLAKLWGVSTPREAADAIEALSKQHEQQRQNLIALMNEKPRWIPVTERSPEEDEEVLVVAVNDFNKYDRWAAVDWLYRGEWQQHSIVTHWMHLPEPPKEEA